MKNYFEKTYPRRLKDLKETCEVVVCLYPKYMTNNDDCNRMIYEVRNVINLFLENTSLHLKQLYKSETASDKYILMIKNEYIHKYLGDTVTGDIFRVTYLKKEGEI